jgi:hypothetical protein
VENCFFILKVPFHSIANLVCTNNARQFVTLEKNRKNLLNLPANICSTTINVEKFCLDYSAPEGGKILKTDM